jgi:hypothetical protein
MRFVLGGKHGCCAHQAAYLQAVFFRDCLELRSLQGAECVQERTSVQRLQADGHGCGAGGFLYTLVYRLKNKAASDKYDLQLAKKRS